MSAGPLAAELHRLAGRLDGARFRPEAGRLVAVTGPLLRAELPAARIGELCALRNPEGGETRFAEVVGLDGAVAVLAPQGSTAGLSARTLVTALGRVAAIPVGDHLLGSVVDAFAAPLEGAGTPAPPGAQRRPLDAPAPPALARRAIARPLPVGLRAIDGLLTCAEGQRIGIFGSAGAGKSTLVGDIVGGTVADVIVVALVGERGREVGDFVTRVLGPRLRPRSVVVAATADRPPAERMQAARVATTIAEHFRDRGARVLLVVDSVTRLARALREVGLAAGEPPARRGFPPSVFAALPQLFERAGMGTVGSITAFYTVLVEGDAAADPVAEETRSLLDGHIVLSDRLAAAGHFPAIDVLASRSRVMGQVVSAAHRAAAARVAALLAKWRDIELLVEVGEYRSGADPLADRALARRDAITAFLVQQQGETAGFDATVAALAELAR